MHRLPTKCCWDLQVNRADVGAKLALIWGWGVKDATVPFSPGPSSPAQRWQGQGLPWFICPLALNLSGCLLLAGKCHLSLVLPGLCRAISSLWCSLKWFTLSYWESLLYSRDAGCKEKCHRLWHRFQPTQSWQDLSIREDKFFFFMAVLIKTRIPSPPFASPTHSILLPFIL